MNELLTPNNAASLVHADEPIRFRHRGEIEPAIRVTRRPIRSDPRLFLSEHRRVPQAKFAVWESLPVRSTQTRWSATRATGILGS